MQRHVGAAIALAFGLVGCTPGIDAVPVAYQIQGNYDDIASCLYRRVEDEHGFRSSVNLTRLSNPPEIRVALTSTAGRARIAQLAWEVKLQPTGATATRMLVRQMGTLVQARPFWSSVLEPMITQCAGGRPVPA